MKYRFQALAIACTVLFQDVSANAGILAQYQFTSGSAAATAKAGNVSADNLAFATGFTTNTGFSSGGNVFARVNGTTATTLADAITDHDYVTVTISPNPGFELDLSNLTVDIGYSLDGASVPTGVGVQLSASVFSSVNGFTADKALATQTFTAANQGSTGIFYQSVNIDLSGPAHQDLTAPIEFRIYLYDSVSGSSPTQPVHRIDNFTLNGEAAAASSTLLTVKGISIDTSSNLQLLFSGTPGTPCLLYRSTGLETPYYRKRWVERYAGAFPPGASELQIQEPKGSESKGFFVATQTEPRARILCLGDSITEGDTAFVVYKGPLYDKLTTAGYRFDYVGSKSSTYTSPTYGAVSLAHEGYSGQNCTQIASTFATTSPLHPADIVIIHSAHNLNTAEAVLTPTQEAAIVTTVENATRSMIQTARNTNPSVIVLLSKVIPSGKLPKYSYIPAVNLRLGELAAELHTPTQAVISVDQATGFDWTTDTISDRVHPNAAGGEKMAQKFFDALVPLLE